MGLRPTGLKEFALFTETDQWWSEGEPVEIAGQGQMLYSVLGPVMARHMLALFQQAEEADFDLSPGLQRLHRELVYEDGRSPRFLTQIALALAAQLAPEHPGLFRGVGPTLIDAAQRQRYEILKEAGWQIAQRLQSFGFDEVTFALHVAEGGPWPPRGVAVQNTPPSSPLMAPHTRDADRVRDSSGLSIAERCLLLDHLPLPPWADDFNQTTRRMMALAQAAVDGRTWAQPYVEGWERRILGGDPERWGSALGVDEATVRDSILTIVGAMFPGRRDLDWQFDT